MKKIHPDVSKERASYLLFYPSCKYIVAKLKSVPGFTFDKYIPLYKSIH